jgi:phage protein D
MKWRTLWVCLPCIHDYLIEIEYILEIVFESDQLELFDVADSTTETNEWLSPTFGGICE